MTDLEQLALKCETASWPDRELDLAIHVALHPDGDIARVMGNRRGFDSQDGLAWDICGASVCYERYTDGRCWANGGYPLPAYSASLDDAMTLVGDNWWSVESGCDGLFFAKVLPWSADCRTGTARHGAAPALALTAACLRAKAALAKEPTR